jgi:capsular polysaccharide transport system permease protein
MSDEQDKKVPVVSPSLAESATQGLSERGQNREPTSEDEPGPALETTRVDRLRQFEHERDERIAIAEAKREKAREQFELERQNRIKTADQDRIERGEQNRLQNLQIAEEKEERARLLAAEAIPDPLAIDEARKKLHHSRQRDLKLSARKFALAVILPTLLTALYLFVVATPLYKSEAVFSIQTSSSTSNSVISGFMGVGGFNSSLKDAFMAREYILSRSMMVWMEQEHGFSSHFRDDEIDFFTRSHAGSLLGTDDFADYVRRVDVGIDVQEGILRLFVWARSPEDSVRFANVLLKKAEARVNELSDQMFDDQVSLMQGSVSKMEGELKRARSYIIDLQIEYGEVAPRESVNAIHSSIQALEQKIKDAERLRDMQLLSNVNDSPAISKLGIEIGILQSQVERQRALLVDNQNDQSLGNILAKFEYAGVQRDIAQQRWEFSLESLEGSRRNALLQRQYLMVVSPALLPEYPEKMGRVRTVLYTFLILSVVFFAYSVFSTAIRARTRLSKVSLQEPTTS